MITVLQISTIASVMSPRAGLFPPKILPGILHCISFSCLLNLPRYCIFEESRPVVLLNAPQFAFVLFSHD